MWILKCFTIWYTSKTNLIQKTRSTTIPVFKHHTPSPRNLLQKSIRFTNIEGFCWRLHTSVAVFRRSYKKLAMSFKCQRSFSGGKVTNWRGMINGRPAGGRTECSDYLLRRWARSLYVRRWHDLIDLQRQDICCSSHKFHVTAQIRECDRQKVLFRNYDEIHRLMCKGHACCWSLR